MAHSLAVVYLHIVFCTKHRYPFLGDRTLRLRMHQYLGAVLESLGCQPIRIGGVEDHVHIACRGSRELSFADLVRDLKRSSSRWIKAQHPDVTNFFWQSGYGVFSVSPSHVKALSRYIANQEEHHRDVDFQMEMERLQTIYAVPENR